MRETASAGRLSNDSQSGSGGQDGGGAAGGRARRRHVKFGRVLADSWFAPAHLKDLGFPAIFYKEDFKNKGGSFGVWRPTMERWRETFSRRALPNGGVVEARHESINKIRG